MSNDLLEQPPNRLTEDIELVCAPSSNPDAIMYGFLQNNPGFSSLYPLSSFPNFCSLQSLIEESKNHSSLTSLLESDITPSVYALVNNWVDQSYDFIGNSTYGEQIRRMERTLMGARVASLIDIYNKHIQINHFVNIEMNEAFNYTMDLIEHSIKTPNYIVLSELARMMGLWQIIENEAAGFANNLSHDAAKFKQMMSKKPGYVASEMFFNTTAANYFDLSEKATTVTTKFMSILN